MAARDETAPRYDVVVVGDGVAGLSAGLFTARHDLRTLVVGTGESILRRNAHLENYPGFPGGIDARRLLASMREQAEESGCSVVEGEVVEVEAVENGSVENGSVENGSVEDEAVEEGTVENGSVEGEQVRPADENGSRSRFEVTTGDGRRWAAGAVVAATKNEVAYLRDVDGVEVREPGKAFVVTDDRGRTGVDGLYAAGRLAGKPHQTVVAAGHGAEVAVTLLEDDDTPFYHDWVAPEGYFTGRGREVPPGCEEIDDAERRARDERARAALRERFDDPYPDAPEQHPSVDTE